MGRGPFVVKIVDGTEAVSRSDVADLVATVEGTTVDSIVDSDAFELAGKGEPDDVAESNVEPEMVLELTGGGMLTIEEGRLKETDTGIETEVAGKVLGAKDIDPVVDTRDREVDGGL